MNDISLYMYSIVPHICLSKGVLMLFIWNAAMSREPLNMLIVYSTTMILMRYSPSEKSKGSFDFFQNIKIKNKTLAQLHLSWALVLPKISLWFQSKGGKARWEDGTQMLAVNPCSCPEPWSLCRTTDCEGQHNPQCLVFQWLIKYLMC